MFQCYWIVNTGDSSGELKRVYITTDGSLIETKFICIVIDDSSMKWNRLHYHLQ